MKKRANSFPGVILRYLILILFGIISSFSSILSSFLFLLTIYPVNFLLNLFSFDSFINNNFIFVNSLAIEIIPACIAVSAYYLLLILNLSTPMNLKKRIYSLAFSLFLILLVNILRIFIMSLLFIYDFAGFDFLHKFFWYSLSIFIVAGIWFLEIKIFKIKEIPFYSDVKSLFKKIKNA